jgi:hypothetical protein
VLAMVDLSALGLSCRVAGVEIVKSARR